MRKLFHPGRDRGAAAVEFALVLPVLVMLLVGIVDFGMVTNAQAIAGNAARDGARAASLGAKKADACEAALQASSSLLNFSDTGSCGTSTPSITVTCQTPGGAACSSDFDTSREIGGTAVVTVTYVYHWISPAVFGLPGTTTITKSAYMRIETTS
ncbi:MAG TPA: pilus assembly protein TadE [Propionibacteriaceae bacterium]|nr:pilus assembly protein TadE [Propionibacteriaceae bacterium]